MTNDDGSSSIRLTQLFERIILNQKVHLWRELIIVCNTLGEFEHNRKISTEISSVMVDNYLITQLL